MKTKILAAAAAIVVIVALFSVYGSRDLIMTAMGMNDNMTEAEYMEALDGLSAELESFQKKTDGIDIDDIEGAKAYIDGMKRPFEDFAAIDNPPRVFAEGHEKIRQGCDGMAEYLDIVKGIVGETDEEILADASSKMTVKLSAAMNDLSEGAAMIEKAK